MGLQNKLTESLQKGKISPMSVMDMTLNNLMVRFLWRWSFEEYRSQIHFGSEW